MGRRVLVEFGYGAIIILVCVSLFLFVSEFSVEDLTRIAGENRVAGLGIFALTMLATTVIAPLSSLPMVPLVAPFFGPFATGLAAFGGWTLGAFIAFFIGRHYGRPVVTKFIKEETLMRYERYLTPDAGIFLIMMLRMLVPVDVLSYGLAMLTPVSFRVYALGTVVGIMWFSFAFAYGGSAIANGDYVLFAGISVASLIIVYLSWRQVKRLTDTD